VEAATKAIAVLVEDKKITRQCGRDLVAYVKGLTEAVNTGRQE